MGKRTAQIPGCPGLSKDGYDYALVTIIDDMIRPCLDPGHNKPCGLFSIPEIYEVLKKHLHNKVVKTWTESLNMFPLTEDEK